VRHRERHCRPQQSGHRKQGSISWASQGFMVALCSRGCLPPFTSGRTLERDAIHTISAAYVRRRTRMFTSRFSPSVSCARFSVAIQCPRIASQIASDQPRVLRSRDDVMRIGHRSALRSLPPGPFRLRCRTLSGFRISDDVALIPCNLHDSSDSLSFASILTRSLFVPLLCAKSRVDGLGSGAKMSR
jgi:hypothetical protein